MNHLNFLCGKRAFSDLVQWLHSNFLKRAIICSTMIVAFVGTASGSDLPVITSFGQNGLLVASNMQPGTISSVEWAASLEGPWHTNWASLTGVKVDSNSTIIVSVPMFYRLRGVPRADNPTNAEGLRLIPSGSFTMGNTVDIGGPAPVDVFVSAFYMDPTEVTRGLWSSVYYWATNNGYNFVAGDGVSSSPRPTNHPMTTVTWHDAVKWCNARSEQAGLSPVYFTDAALTKVYKFGVTNDVYVNWDVDGNNGYRLPTDAEWEKAARGGLHGLRFPWGNTITHEMANFNSVYPDELLPYDLGPYSGRNTNVIGANPYTLPVGFFPANGYGLYDMAGNYNEWVWDWAGAQSTTNNPRGPSSGTERIVRDGSGNATALLMRCFSKISSAPNLNAIGFRTVRGYAP